MVTIPSTVFGLLTLIVTTLCGVILYQQRKIDNLYKANSDLQDKRLNDANLVRDRYDNVMGKFSQSFDLFAAKIETRDK